MRYVRVPFSTNLFYKCGGIAIKPFSEMLLKFPPDSKVLGFRESVVDLIAYIFIGSDSFEDVAEVNFPPDVHPLFRKHPDGTISCESIDFGTALKTKVCSRHLWVGYVGLQDQYTYCKNCGVKQ